MTRTLMLCICEKCKYAWVSELETLPKKCVMCKSKIWNREGAKQAEIAAKRSVGPQGPKTTEEPPDVTWPFGREGDYDMNGKEYVRPELDVNAAVTEVFEHWKTVCNHPASILDPKRKALIATRLKQFSIIELKRAIDGNKLDPFSQGENERGKVFDGLELILRDAAHVEKFVEIATYERQFAAAHRGGTEDGEPSRDSETPDNVVPVRNAATVYSGEPIRRSSDRVAEETPSDPYRTP